MNPLEETPIWQPGQPRLLDRVRDRCRVRHVRDDDDREKRVDGPQHAGETYGWHLFAFVLMPNHEHLFLKTPEPNLSAGMQYLNGSYTSYFNRRHRCAGHLFHGRFKGHVVEEEGYFLEVSRYIHLNPVRAQMAVRRGVSWEQLSRLRPRVGRCRGSCTTRCWANVAATCRPLDVRTVGSCVRGSTSLHRRHLARQSAGCCWARRSS